MTPRFRPYQSQLDRDIDAAWQAGARVVMARAPTRSGKTIIFSKKLREHSGASCAIAHRRELIAQMSLALARNGVRHRIVGPEKTRKACRQLQMRKLGRHFVDPNARCAAASVDTLVSIPASDPWLAQVTLWVGDEGHHFLKNNKWGKAVAAFKNPACRGLLVTATPVRADGKGLGIDNDGLADAMVAAPDLRELIYQGYILDTRIFTVPSDIDYSHIPVGESGDLVQAKLREAVHASGTFVGSVVDTYLKLIPNKKAILFAVDVESASEIAAKFRARGVPAEVLSANTADDIRAITLRKFERREIMVLTNVDLFGEGYDLPDLEAVIMARRTESFPLFAQQSARASNVDVTPELIAHWDEFTPAERRAHIAASGKPHAILLDHVGNVPRHAALRHCPHTRELVLDLCHRDWSLNRAGSRGSVPSGAIPVRYCLNEVCSRPFERFRKCCPWCGRPVPPPIGRATPEEVEGDLGEMDPAALSAFYAKIRDVRNTAPPRHLDGVARAGAQKQIDARAEAQSALQNALAWYGGLMEAQGIKDMGERWRSFYDVFGTDVASIQILSAREMWEWFGKIGAYLSDFGIDVSVNAGL